MTKVIGDYTAANSIDGSTNYLLIQPGNSSTAYKKINRNVFLGVTGQPVDISSSQNLTNKTLDNTNTITLKDTLFTLQDNSDTTKQARFELSGLTTATIRTYTLPDASTTIVGTGTTQTLTNKTLTAPTITNGSITGATIATDAIVGQSASTTGTVYGLSVTSSKISGASITAGTVGSTALAANAVQGNQISTSALTLGYAQITSSFTTTAVSAYTDITSLSVTVTVPAGGRNLKITLFGSSMNTGTTAGVIVTLAIMEGSTVLGSTALNEPVAGYRMPAHVVAYLAAPSPGSHTYKAAIAQTGAGTLTFAAGAANPTQSNPGPAFILVEAI